VRTQLGDAAVCGHEGVRGLHALAGEVRGPHPPAAQTIPPATTVDPMTTTPNTTAPNTNPTTTISTQAPPPTSARSGTLPATGNNTAPALRFGAAAALLGAALAPIAMRRKRDAN
jgi:LPXTG cell wall anchor motif